MEGSSQKQLDEISILLFSFQRPSDRTYLNEEISSQYHPGTDELTSNSQPYTDAVSFLASALPASGRATASFTSTTTALLLIKSVSCLPVRLEIP